MSSGAANAAQDRVSGVSSGQLLARNLRLALAGSLKSVLKSRPAAREPNAQPTAASSSRQWPQNNNNAAELSPREINFSSNAPVPVDVGPAEAPATPAGGQRPRAQPAANQQQRPIDDYWIRQPSDRKWGTLTLAASKLAERRAKARKSEHADAAGLLLTTVASARTLPRSFKSAQSLADGATLQQQQQPPPPPPPPLPPKVAPRATRRPQVEPPAQVQRASNFQNGVNFAAAATAQHRRSISQIEARRASQREQSMLMQQQQQQARGCQWLPTGNWTRQDLSDFASMSFGPPAQVALGGLDWSLAWPAGDSVDAVRAPPSGQLLFNEQPFEQQHLGARNSLARSTLPLTAPQANLGLSVLAPPYSFVHDFGQQQQPVAQAATQQNLSLCPFYPHFLLPAGPAMQAQPYDQHQNQQPSMQSKNSNDDDPLTENACLGSYRRKRRRPNIEAQFTMTKAPELPAKSLASGQQTAFQAATARARTSESESLRRGHLFVRDALPAGLPQPGQRTEQRRLREASPAELQLHRIAARHKVEVYLSHQQLAKRPAPPPPVQVQPEAEVQLEPEMGMQKSSGQLDSTNGPSSSSSSSSTIELNQVNKLTFQPYYNLPSLKYTISLPVESQQDGSLTLKKSASLRPVRQRRRRSSHKLSETLQDADRKLQLIGELNVDPPPIPPHRRLAEQKHGQEQEHEKQRVQVGPTSSNESQRTQTGANVTSGSSPSSSVVSTSNSSSTSSSAASDETAPSNVANIQTAIEQRSRSGAKTRERAAQMQQPDGHSADENYEFDQVSSCSSSRAVRRRVKRRSRSASHSYGTGPHEVAEQRDSFPPEARFLRVSQTPSEAIYTQIDKRRARKRRQQAGADVKRLERSQFYDCATLKEQTLTQDNGPSRAPAAREDANASSMGELTPTQENVAHFYDTVYESISPK